MPREMALPVPASASRHAPLVPDFTAAPDPILHQTQLGIAAPNWPSLGAAPAATCHPPHRPGVRPRKGWGWGQRERGCVHPGLSQVCRASPHPPTARPWRRCHRTGGFYGSGKDFSHCHPGRGEGWQAGRRPLAASCETRERCLGDRSAINCFNWGWHCQRARGTPAASGETLEPVGYRVMPCSRRGGPAARGSDRHRHPPGTAALGTEGRARRRRWAAPGWWCPSPDTCRLRLGTKSAPKVSGH